MMPSPSVNWTLAALLGSEAGPLADLPIIDITTNSAEVVPGAVFIAVPGRTAHGLEFANEAAQRGAVAVLYEVGDGESVTPMTTIPCLEVNDLRARIGSLASRFFGTDARQGPVLGVTGTNGKTTIAWLIAHALNSLGRKAGYLGTVGQGQPQQLKPQALTTPDCITIHRRLAEMNGHAVAMEVSSHALDQSRIDGVPVQVAVLSNVSRDHLDYHGDIEHYRAAKAKLFSSPGLASAVLNVDDEFGSALYDRLRTLPIELTATTLRGRNHDPNILRGEMWLSERVGLHVKGRGVDTVFESQLVGEFNAENLLLAFAALRTLEVPVAEIASALAKCPPPPGRMEAFGGGKTPRVIVDFAHSPQALERVLLSLRLANPNSLTCVFGCGGERDQGKRQEMGRIASQHADFVVLTDDNPRGEDPKAIVEDIVEGMSPGTSFEVEHDRGKAIKLAVFRAGPRDVVLVAGKGHETAQIRGDSRIPLSDRDLVLETVGSP